MWEGRGATARTREAKWSSGVVAGFGGIYYKQTAFKDQFGYHY